MGNDPPGSFTRILHPRLGRHGEPPPDVIPVGRSVIVPANDSLPNIVLSPSAVPRIRRVLEQERFDVLHLHEPMTPAVCVATLAFAKCPVVATWHASGPLRWMKIGLPLWGFLMERIDYRIAVSEPARATIAAWIPGEWEIVPNGTLIPDVADPRNREHSVLFVGRHEPRKGLADPAPGVAGHPPAHRRGAPHHRRRSPRRAAAPLAGRNRRRGHRDRRFPQPGGSHTGAPGREGDGCSLAGRGELRHGAHPRVRLRHARRRLRHRRLPRSDRARDGRAGTACATRARSPTRSWSCSRTRSGASRLVSPRGSSRSSATRGTASRPPDGDLRAGGRVRFGFVRSTWFRIAVIVAIGAIDRLHALVARTWTGTPSPTPSRPSGGSGSPLQWRSTSSRSSRGASPGRS